MRTTLIVNPYASRVTPEVVAAVEAVLRPVATFTTQRAGHATELARAVETEAVAVFSGDGGFNEVLNGLAAGMERSILESVTTLMTGHVNVGGFFKVTAG